MAVKSTSFFIELCLVFFYSVPEIRDFAATSFLTWL